MRYGVPVGRGWSGSFPGGDLVLRSAQPQTALAPSSLLAHRRREPFELQPRSHPPRSPSSPRKSNAGHEVTSHEHRATFCDYYRITTEEFDALQLAETETRLAMILVDLPILERWKAEAADAIAKLEALTGLTFENDSTKSNLRLPSAEAMQTERERLATGC